MYFSSMAFLWVFLPITILFTFIMQRFRTGFLKGDNIVLLIGSLIFYTWGEPTYIILLLLSVLANYLFGLLLEKNLFCPKKLILCLAVLLNIGLLGFYKYSNFLADILQLFLGDVVVLHHSYVLPLGISFYTFQEMSYVIDVYKKEVKAQKNFFHLLFYVSFFPQLVAGPIVKYKDMETQILERNITEESVCYGIKRFCYGLGKKVLLSNVLGKYTDMIFSFQLEQISTGLIWLAMVMYTFQIYYDFSGYSDMAIGLGAIFGFQFQENFNYPYLAKSIREFWRRWHISLSSWFKEYVYIPLGGNRKGRVRTYVNLFLVFFLTGLWHGASWNFIFWGMFHGFFVIAERFLLGRFLDKNPVKVFNHLYVFLVVICGWVFFRIEGIRSAAAVLKGMFVYQKGIYRFSSCINTEVILSLIISVFLCGIVQEKIPFLKKMLFSRKEKSVLQTVCLMVMLFFCIISLSADVYNPFIYFRF